MRLALLLCLTAGCTLDLPVGQLPSAPDAATDAGGTNDATAADAMPAVDAGFPDAGQTDPVVELVLTLPGTDAPRLACADSLGGLEGDFASILAPAVQFGSGPVQYAASETSARLSGDPIMDAFQVRELVLREMLTPDQPPEIILASVPIVNGATGPHNTRVTMAALYIDRSFDPLAGESAFQFETPSGDGACLVGFSFALRPQ